MNNINSLILLVNSLSKSEKKSIYLHSNLTKGIKVYMELFNLIDKQKIVDSTLLAEQFKTQFSKASFHPTARYLYDFILTVLVKLKMTQDKEFNLYQKILNAKILSERNLDDDYYSTLQQLKTEAGEISNYHLLLIIRRMELDFLRLNGFKDLSENALLQKQHKTSDTLKIIRQINEQSSLYELLLLRLEKITPSQGANRKESFNDLVVSEISLVSNLNRNVFEIQKLHQLFQAYYLINAGDYKSALNSFIELDKLFNANKTLWNNPPLYYATVLEGVLRSLRGIGEYEQMSYFLEKLKQLEHPSIPFQTEIACIRFIYTIVPHLDREEYSKCMHTIEEYRDTLVQRINLLTPYRYMQLSLYLSIIYLVNSKLNLARNQLTPIINSDSYVGIWLFRPIQLLNLIIHHELGDIDILTSQIRSMKRQNKIKNKKSKVEDILFHFLKLDMISLNDKNKKDLINKLQKEFNLIETNNEEMKLMTIFRFDRWILDQINNKKKYGKH